jgi:hypothetical protein
MTGYPEVNFPISDNPTNDRRSNVEAQALPAGIPNELHIGCGIVFACWDLRRNQEMKIVRLSWAGIQLTARDTTLVIDLLEDTAPLVSFLGRRERKLFPPAGRWTLPL